MNTLIMNIHDAHSTLTPREIEARVVDVRRGSVWGNPYPHGWVSNRAATADGVVYRSREAAVSLYKELMISRVRGRPGPVYAQKDPGRYRRGKGPTTEEVMAEANLWINRLEALQGKILVCQCSAPPCHAYVLRTMSDPDQIALYRRDIHQRNRKNINQKRRYDKVQEASNG